MYLYAVVAALILQVVCGSTSSPGDLTAALLNSYPEAYRYARPVDNHTETLGVNFGASLIRVKDLGHSDTGTFQVWLRYMWRDAHLSWDPSDFGGQTQAYLPTSKIWTPDIRLFNSIDDDMSMGQTDVLVYNTGDVLWIPPTTLRVPCGDKGSEEYVCSFRFGSWTYDGFKLDLKFSDGLKKMDVTYFESSDKILVNEGRKHVKYYPCCTEPYPDITFYLRIQGDSKLKGKLNSMRNINL